MQTLIKWLKPLFFFIIILIFSNPLQAVDITLDNTIEKINGDADSKTCYKGDIYRLGTLSSYKGQRFDVLLEVLAEENEADTLDTFAAPFSERPCIGVKNGLIETVLRDREDENGNNDDNTAASMDLELKVVKMGTLIPITVDRLQFTALDLDRSGNTTLSDDIYLSTPGRGFVEDNESLISIFEGNYGNGYDILMQGNRDISKPEVVAGEPLSNGNCKDTIETPQPECRASGVIALKNPQDSLRLRVANDNAFGGVANSNKRLYRLIQISLKEGELVGLGVDHGDMPESYGDAFSDVHISFVLGNSPADGEDVQYSPNADADDTNSNDDEGAVSIVDIAPTGSVLTMTQEYMYDFNVTTTGSGYLSAWIDYNLNGSFDSEEQLIADKVISSVTTINTLIPITVLSDSSVGKSYIRVRFSENTGVEATGYGGNGEVEDYVVNVIASGSVSGHVYNDKNANGTQDAGEASFSNVSVSLIAENGENQTTTTDVNGDYSFSGVSVGTASVDIDETTLPQGAEKTIGTTDPTSVTVFQNQENFEENNGYKLQANLVTTKTVDNAIPQEGSIVTYTVSVTNDGPSQATNVSLIDKLPVGVTYQSYIGNGSYDVTSGLWTIGTIDNSQTETLQIKAVVNQGTSGSSITNIATTAFTLDQNDPTIDSDDLDETVIVGGLPIISISDVTVIEGNELVFDINISNSSNFDTLINITTNNGTAVSPSDYTQVIQTVTIPAGSTSRTFTVPTIDDILDEADAETMTLNGTITSKNTSTDNILGTGTILDNDSDVKTEDDTIIADVSGEPASINILDNDDNSTNPSTISFIHEHGVEGKDTDGDGDIDTLVVLGEGTWSVDENGVVTFTPEKGFTGDPTPISYTVENDQGNVSEPTEIKADYPQNATDVTNDSITAPISEVSINIIENDSDSEDDINVSSINLIAPEANLMDIDGDGDMDQVVVSGEGVWNVNHGGILTFTPEAGFTGDPTPIAYTVTDDTGLISEPATVSVDFEQTLNDDSATGIAHRPVNIEILDNDDEVIVSTISLQGTDDSTQTDTDGDGDIDQIIVPGEGIWSVDDEGILTFTPEEHFIGDPTPITYTAKDEQGNTLEAATVTIDYVSIGFLIEPVAVDDSLDILVDRDHIGDASDNDTPGEGGKDRQRFQIINPDTNNTISVGETLELEYGVVSMEENGIYTYNPLPNIVGIDNFRYVLEDSLGQRSEANVVINVDCSTSQKSNSASSLNEKSSLLMIIFIGLTGLYFIRRKENRL